MRQVICKQPVTKAEEPLCFQLQHAGGYEGVHILLSAGMVNGPPNDILKTDEQGRVWIGKCHRVLLGRFTAEGLFLVESNIEALSK